MKTYCISIDADYKCVKINSVFVHHTRIPYITHGHARRGHRPPRYNRHSTVYTSATPTGYCTVCPAVKNASAVFRGQFRACLPEGIRQECCSSPCCASSERMPLPDAQPEPPSLPSCLETSSGRAELAPCQCFEGVESPSSPRLPLRSRPPGVDPHPPWGASGSRAQRPLGTSGGERLPRCACSPQARCAALPGLRP